jgi:hypothetical protein
MAIVNNTNINKGESSDTRKRNSGNLTQKDNSSEMINLENSNNNQIINNSNINVENSIRNANNNNNNINNTLYNSNNIQNTFNYESNNARRVRYADVRSRNEQPIINNLDINSNNNFESNNKKDTSHMVNFGQKGNIVNKYVNDESLVIGNKKKKFNKFKMGFTELLFIMIPCCKNPQLMMKKKIFEECGQIIQNFFDIERIISLLREYQELRNVVLSSNEYKILKYLTTPKIEINEGEVNIKQFEKYTTSDKEIKKNYSHFVDSMNHMLKKNLVTLIENNLIELHKMSMKGVIEEENEEEN